MIIHLSRSTCTILAALLVLVTPTLALAQNPMDKVSTAIDNLENAESCSWDYFSLGSRWSTGNEFGSVDKDGVMHVQVNGRRGIEFLKKDNQFAIRRQNDQWFSMDELFKASQSGPWTNEKDALFTLYAYRTPVEEARMLLEGVEELKICENGAYEGTLTESGAQRVMTFKSPEEGENPPPRDCHGSVRFVIESGILKKMEVKISGIVTWGEGREFDSYRSSLIEFSVPMNSGLTAAGEAAESKLSPLPENFWK